MNLNHVGFEDLTPHKRVRTPTDDEMEKRPNLNLTPTAMDTVKAYSDVIIPPIIADEAEGLYANGEHNGENAITLTSRDPKRSDREEGKMSF